MSPFLESGLPLPHKSCILHKTLSAGCHNVYSHASRGSLLNTRWQSLRCTPAKYPRANFIGFTLVSMCTLLFLPMKNSIFFLCFFIPWHKYFKRVEKVYPRSKNKYLHFSDYFGRSMTRRFLCIHGLRSLLMIRCTNIAIIAIVL